MIKDNADSTLKQAEKYIKRAWITAIVCGAWSFFFSSSLDGILCFIFACGIYVKSRISTILMMVSFIIGQILYRIENVSEYAWISVFGIPLLIAYFFARGVQGTFIYHKYNSEHNTAVQHFTDGQNLQEHHLLSEEETQKYCALLNFQLQGNQNLPQHQLVSSFCTHCGREILPDYRFCTGCGRPIQP